MGAVAAALIELETRMLTAANKDFKVVRTLPPRSPLTGRSFKKK
jgi:hypothetical protein